MKMLLRNLRASLSLVSAGLLLGCVSAGPIANADRLQKRLELYSIADERSSMPKLKEQESVTTAVEQLKLKNSRVPTVESLINLARLQLLQEQYQSAEESCRRALKLDLKSIESRKVLAEIYIRTHRLDLAAIILNGLQQNAERDSQVLNLLALIAVKKGQMTEALSRFKAALEVNPNDVAVRMNLGVLLLEYRQLAEAGVQFERVLKIFPKHNDARLHLAIVRANRGELVIAEKMYREVLKAQEDNPLALYNLAVLTRNANRFDESLALLKRYLATASARTADNTAVFALIEDIQKRQEASGDGKPRSDDEIQALAAKLKQAQTGFEPSGGKGSTAAAPKRTEGESDSNDEELKKLEKELK